jgi:hypothetical protein
LKPIGSYSCKTADLPLLLPEEWAEKRVDEKAPCTSPNAYDTINKKNLPNTTEAEERSFYEWGKKPVGYAA